MIINYYKFIIAVLKKQISAIANLAHLGFAKDRQNPNKLNFFSQQYCVLSAQLCASHSVQSKCASHGVRHIYFNHFNTNN